MIEFAIVLFIKRRADQKKVSSLMQRSRAARVCSMKIQTLQAMETECLKRNTIAEMQAYTFTDKIDFAAFSFLNISFSNMFMSDDFVLLPQSTQYMS